MLASKSKDGGDFNQNAANIAAIQAKAREGSPTALDVLETLAASQDLEKFTRGRDTFTSSEKLQILNMLYEFITRDFQVVIFPEETYLKLKRLVCEMFESRPKKTRDETDMKIRIIHWTLNVASAFSETEEGLGVELLKDGNRLYPNNVHYYKLLSNFCATKGEYELSFLYAERGLEKFPYDLDLHYSKAFALRNEKPVKVGVVIEALGTFLEKAPIDHPKVPDAFYSMAFMHTYKCEVKDSAGLAMTEYYYNLGNETERRILLPCHLPWASSNDKLAVHNLLASVKPKPVIEDGASDAVHCNRAVVERMPMPISLDVEQAPVLQRKLYLNHPGRQEFIIKYRQLINQFSLVRKSKTSVGGGGFGSHQPTLRQTLPRRISGLKPLFLKDINPTTNHIYEDQVIDLTIIDEPNLYLSLIHLLAEDLNKDVVCVWLDNMEKSKENIAKLGFGSRIAVFNPYLRIGAADGSNGIRNYDPRCVFYLDGVENMCRFCGEENASLSCSKCKKAKYCCKECQELDWKMLKHKLVCSKK